MLSQVNIDKINDFNYILKTYDLNNFLFITKLLNSMVFEQNISIWLAPNIFKEKFHYFPKLLFKNNTTPQLIYQYDINEILKKDWFLHSLSKNISYWTNPYILEKNNIIIYTLPVYVENKLLAIITIDIDIGILENSLMNLYDSNYMYLLDTKLMLIFHSLNDQLVGKKLFDIITNNTITEKDILNNENGVFEYMFITKKIAAWFKLYNNYYMTISIDKSNIFQHIKKEIIYSIIICIMFIIISIGVLYIFNLSKPLVLIEKTITKCLGKRDVHVTVKIRKNYESGKISTAINKLFNNLFCIFQSRNNTLCDRKKANLFKNVTQELSANLQEMLAYIIQIMEKTNGLFTSILKINSNNNNNINTNLELTDIINKHNNDLNCVESNVLNVLINLQKIQKQLKYGVKVKENLDLSNIIQDIESIKNFIYVLNNNIRFIGDINKRQYICIKNINSITELAEEDSLFIREVSNNIQFVIDSVVKEIEELALKTYQLKEDI